MIDLLLGEMKNKGKGAELCLTLLASRTLVPSAETNTSRNTEAGIPGRQPGPSEEHREPTPGKGVKRSQRGRQVRPSMPRKEPPL